MQNKSNRMAGKLAEMIRRMRKDNIGNARMLQYIERAATLAEAGARPVGLEFSDWEVLLWEYFADLADENDAVLAPMPPGAVRYSVHRRHNSVIINKYE